MSPVRRALGIYIRRHLSVLAGALGLSALVGVLEPVSLVMLQSVFDTMLQGLASTLKIPVLDISWTFEVADGRALLVTLVFVIIFKAAAQYGGVTATAYLGQAVTREIRNDVFGRILSQPLAFFHRNPTGDLISRVSADIEKIQDTVADTLAEFFKQSAIVVCLTAFILYQDWLLSLISMAIVPPVVWLTRWFGQRMRALGQSGQQERAGMANVLYEAFSGNRIVKAFLMEKVENSRFREVTQRLFQIGMRQRMTHALTSPIMETLGALVVAAFVLYASAGIQSKRMSVSAFLAFIFALVKLYDAIRRMSGINNSFQQALGASTRIVEILELETERDSGNVAAARFSRAIEFRRVTFGYEPDLRILDGVSFEARQGEVVAIVGSSGAGKTTVVNLLPRFYDVWSGEILIDGVDIRTCKLDSLRRQFALVTQDVILFDDTIWGNIAYGDPTASREAILAAARAALVDDFVSALPEKYETRIGERGLRLSGGERQRISIARALLKNAPVLILDEATSALDAESEVYVQRALENLMQGRTTIVIAHRLSTIRRADRIVALADGRVQEIGSHDELIARRGVYWKLYSHQVSVEASAGHP
jgi:subfamily B ATP-binding cassette protein MsbA